MADGYDTTVTAGGGARSTARRGQKLASLVRYAEVPLLQHLRGVGVRGRRAKSDTDNEESTGQPNGVHEGVARTEEGGECEVCA